MWRPGSAASLPELPPAQTCVAMAPGGPRARCVGRMHRAPASGSRAAGLASLRPAPAGRRRRERRWPLRPPLPPQAGAQSNVRQCGARERCLPRASGSFVWRARSRREPHFSPRRNRYGAAQAPVPAMDALRAGAGRVPRWGKPCDPPHAPSCASAQGDFASLGRGLRGTPQGRCLPVRATPRRRNSGVRSMSAVMKLPTMSHHKAKAAGPASSGDGAFDRSAVRTQTSACGRTAGRRARMRADILASPP